MSVLESGVTPVVRAVTGLQAQSTYGLRFRCLSPLEVLAQSVANIAPSACMVAFIPLVYFNDPNGGAGNGTWLAFVVASIGLALVGMNINEFSRVSASPGSLYSYVTMGLGPTSGVLCGWGLMAAYLGTAVAVGGAGTKFALMLFHGSPDVWWQPQVAFLGVALVTWFAAFKDIRLSARMMLTLEFTSVGLLLFLGVVIFAKFGFKPHIPEFALQGVTAKGFFLGLVVAIFCYVGFESSTTLGEEAKNPLRTIPHAVLGSVVIVGLCYTFMSLAEVGGFVAANSKDVITPDNVLPTLSQATGMGPLIHVLVAMALVSALGCVLACLNAGSRILFSMGRHGVFHQSMGGAHEVNETPHMAVTVCAIIMVAASAAMMARKMDVLGLGCTFATFGFLLAYIMISLAAPFYMKKRGLLTSRAIAISVGAMIFMLVPLVGSFYPVPDAPYVYVPYLFFGFMAVGVVWLLIRRWRSTTMVDKIEKDLEEIGQRFNVGKSMFAADKEPESRA